MSEIHQTVQGVLAQYQRNLVTRVGLLMLFGVSCLAALLWRLQALGVGVPWRIVIGSVGSTGLFFWQWQAVRRAWLHRSQVAMKLDQALGLHARLLTAEEFAAVPNPPLLYPLLMEDTAQALSTMSKRLPPLADRWTIVLAVVLLFLLLWPWSRPSRLQLAMQTPMGTPPPPPPPQSPPDLSTQKHDEQKTQSQQQGSQNQQQASQHQQSGGGSGAQDQQQSREGSPGQASQGRTDQSSGTQGAPSGSSAEPRQSQPSQEAPAGHTGRQTQTNQAPSTSPSQPTQQSDQARQSESAQRQAQTSQRQSGQATSQQASSGSRENASATQQPSAQGQGNSNMTKTGSNQLGASQSQMGQGTGETPGLSAQQELLKADIQQLLKELSGELKQLQTQLEQGNRSNQPNPAPGTSTDPDLYGAASLEKATGNPLPIQLDVDTHPTSTKRRGGGVGEPSGQIADATPQQASEDATLAEHQMEEDATRRQPIPPEYRPVFERLSHTSQ